MTSFLSLHSDWLSRKSQVISCICRADYLWNEISQRRTWKKDSCKHAYMWMSVSGVLSDGHSRWIVTDSVSVQPTIWNYFPKVWPLAYQNSLPAITQQCQLLPTENVLLFVLFTLEGPQTMSCKVEYLWGSDITQSTIITVIFIGIQQKTLLGGSLNESTEEGKMF